MKNFSFQKWVLIAGVLLFLLKLAAWLMTNSDAVMSDMLESTVNIIAALMGLYSLRLAAKPRDEDHPYGHGKIEFVTSGIEGALISFAGAMIIFESFNSLLFGNELKKLDWGMLMIFATAVANYLLGYISIKKGKNENSPVLISSGKHLQSDTITTVGVIVSLALVYFTKIFWLDAVSALVFGGYIIFVGGKIIRQSLRGIMDEADPELLKTFAEILEKNRHTDWIDVHNTKIQQYGSGLHIDAHVTLPYYFSLREAHGEMSKIVKLLAANSNRTIEFNFHMDDCKPFSCPHCSLDCPKREKDFQRKIIWTSENISQQQKHCL